MRFTRVTLFFIAFIITLGFYQLARHFLAEVEPQTFQATEEMMVDTANLLAEHGGGGHARKDRSRRGNLRKAFDSAHARRFESRIFDHLKHQVGINAYLTDAQGIVVFDSDGGRREGQDFSSKRDVSLTLAGRYGARSSRENPDDSATSVLYVAAPVGDPKQPRGRSNGLQAPTRRDAAGARTAAHHLHRLRPDRQRHPLPHRRGVPVVVPSDRQNHRIRPRHRTRRTTRQTQNRHRPRSQHPGPRARFDARRAGGPRLRRTLHPNAHPRNEKPARRHPRRGGVAQRGHARWKPASASSKTSSPKPPAANA